MAAGWLLLPLACLSAARSDRAATSPPHILFIVVDDLGWNDVGYQNDALPGEARAVGVTFLHRAVLTTRSDARALGQLNSMLTPNIDQLAGTGVVLDDYTVYKYCSPSRSQMLVGRYAYHIGQQSGNLGNGPGDSCALSTKYAMLPAALKRAPLPYRTHALGKWHQGFYAPKYTPTKRGFDTFFGFYDGGESHFTHITPFSVWKEPGVPYWWTPAANKSYPTKGCGALVDHSNNTVDRVGPADPGLNGSYNAELITREAVRLIQAHPTPAVPFFMYAAFHGVHTPLEAPVEYTARYSGIVGDRDRKMLGGMISAVDDGIGEIVRAMQRRKLWNNTLVLLTTDNGGPVCLEPSQETQRGEKIVKSCGTNNWPLRGSKMTYWQGGTRGIGLLSGPRIPPAVRGTRHPGMIHQVDWYPTLLRLAGLSTKQISDTGPVTVDGVDQWAAITGTTKVAPRTELVHNIDGDAPGAIRVGQWKLLVGWPGASAYNAFDGWWRPPEMGGAADSSPTKKPCSTHPCLFNIATDPFERDDLSRNVSTAGVLTSLLLRYAELRKSEVTRAASGLCQPAVPDGCSANVANGQSVWQPWWHD